MAEEISDITQQKAAKEYGENLISRSSNVILFAVLAILGMIFVVFLSIKANMLSFTLIMSFCAICVILFAGRYLFSDFETYDEILARHIEEYEIEEQEREERENEKKERIRLEVQAEKKKKDEFKQYIKSVLSEIQNDESLNIDNLYESWNKSQIKKEE